VVNPVARQSLAHEMIIAFLPAVVASSSISDFPSVAPVVVVATVSFKAFPIGHYPMKIRECMRASTAIEAH